MCVVGFGPCRADDIQRAQGGGASGEREVTTVPRLKIVVFLVFLAGMALAVIKPPLFDVHWDAPIMLYAGKRVVDSDFHSNFVRNAAEVARQVEQADWDRSVAYFPEPFWVFTKLGHLSLLSGFLSLGETPEEGLRIAHLGFGGLLAASVAMALLLARNLALLRGWSGSPGALRAGLTVTGLSCVLSGIFWYLSGNFVSEVSALFFVCASLLVLSIALRNGSPVLAALSGLLLFATYWCRPDFAWVAICLALVLLAEMRPRRWRAGTLVPILIGGGVAVLCFAVYASIYRPLADPRLYMTFANLLRSYAPSSPGHFFRLYVIGGGLLWIGMLLALIVRPWHRGVGFGAIWFALTALPWVMQAGLGAAAQSRMFVMSWPPLILLCALGWTALFERARRVRRRHAAVATFAALLAVCALVSIPASYAVLGELPGGWRLQYLRSWLVPDLYERRTYPVRTLVAMRDAIHSGGEPALVIIDSRLRGRSNLDILRFLGPPHGPAGGDLTLVPWPHAHWENPASPSRGGEPVIYRISIKLVERQAWSQGRLRLFTLSNDADHGWARDVARGAHIDRVVAGDDLVLTELVPDIRP